jgi:predicted nuclease of predicted toxin-antitoxin system
MKLLFDQNISHRLIKQISDILPAAKQVRDFGIENYSDKSIWEFAKENKYTIVTFDSDFYDFSLVWGHPPKIVWIRTYNQTTKHVEELLRKHYETIRAFICDDGLACLEIINS